MWLYLDTTSNLTLGLFDRSEKWWVEEFKTQKTSLILQEKIWSLLDKHTIKLSQIESIVYMAGPGSYTGMRIGKGFIDICEWQGIDTYSLYHFHVPQMLGQGHGLFVENAFKNEWFIYDYSTQKSELISREQLEQKVLGIENLFSIEGKINGAPSLATKKLVHENGVELMKKVVGEKRSEDLLYYRPMNQEFRVQNG